MSQVDDNLGGGRFADASKDSGIQKTYGHYCLSITTLDYNDDGWPDIYIACDSTPSILYRNNKNGTFTDVAADAGVAFNEDGREQAGMGSTAGDGRLDIFKTNFSDDTSSLYRSLGNGTFESQVFESGLSLNTQYLGWGTSFLDADNDGRLDLLLVTAMFTRRWTRRTSGRHIGSPDCSIGTLAMASSRI